MVVARPSRWSAAAASRRWPSPAAVVVPPSRLQWGATPSRARPPPACAPAVATGGRASRRCPGRRRRLAGGAAALLRARLDAGGVQAFRAGCGGRCSGEDMAGIVMTETQIGCVSIIASVLAAFALRHSLRTGQSVAPWPHGEVTRRSSPILYWIDFII